MTILRERSRRVVICLGKTIICPLTWSCCGVSMRTPGCDSARKLLLQKPGLEESEMQTSDSHLAELERLTVWIFDWLVVIL